MINPLNKLYEKFPIIRDLIAFSDISDDIARQLSTSCKRHYFSIGDYLCRKNIIPSEIFLINKGEARLIWEDQENIITLEKLGPGSFLGLASFLRAAPCEEIIAASEIEAISLPDTLILKLLQEKKEFFKWSTNTIFTAELAELIRLESFNYPQNGFPLKRAISELKSESNLLPYVGTLNSINQNQELIVASQNILEILLGQKFRRARKSRSLPLLFHQELLS